ncbi:hypothetical protein O7635_29485 [Asanoa sp. WMMD1127]|nr:hypothetical protein [Asanoa sp. WMMD1127]MDG4826002.1 hypothetical protein [Asanoa sp. WMMD1127]
MRKAAKDLWSRIERRVVFASLALFCVAFWIVAIFGVTGLAGRSFGW